MDVLADMGFYFLCFSSFISLHVECFWVLDSWLEKRGEFNMLLNKLKIITVFPDIL